MTAPTKMNGMADVSRPLAQIPTVLIFGQRLSRTLSDRLKLHSRQAGIRRLIGNFFAVVYDSLWLLTVRWAVWPLGTIADYIALGILIALALWTEARLYLRGQVITGAPRCDLRRLILEINIRELLARRCPSRQRRRRCSRLTKGRGSGGLATDNS
jgi:hypothetical protein